MSDHNEDSPPPEPGPKPEDTYALIGNEIRLEIIQILGKSAPNDANEGLSFTELRNRFDTEPDPGRLNYHLQELVGEFVEKTGEEYGLRSKGLQIFFTLQGGVVDQQADDMTVAAGFDCYYCQTAVEAAFTDGRAKIECPSCEYRYLTDNVAPAVATYANERKAFKQFSKVIHHKFLGHARGICQNCGNAVESDLIAPEQNPVSATRHPKVYVAKLCDNCRGGYYLHLGVALLTDPGIVSFCYNHGVEVFTTPYWQLEFAATDNYVTVRSTDPWEVALEVTYDDETLEVVVDGDLTVMERNYRDAADGGPVAQDNRRNDAGPTTPDSERGSGGPVALPSESDCLQVLRRQRWPDGVRCPHCGNADAVKRGTTSKGAQRFLCQNCESTFNDCTGTIFAGHHLRLSEMFYIIWTEDDTDAAEIARQLDRSYKTVLEFVHKVQNVRDDDSDDDLVIAPDVAERALTEERNGMEQ